MRRSCNSVSVMIDGVVPIDDMEFTFASRLFGGVRVTSAYDGFGLVEVAGVVRAGLSEMTFNRLYTGFGFSAICFSISLSPALTVTSSVLTMWSSPPTVCSSFVTQRSSAWVSSLHLCYSLLYIAQFFQYLSLLLDDIFQCFMPFVPTTCF